MSCNVIKEDYDFFAPSGSNQDPIIRDNSNIGWIDNYGNFYPCPKHTHDDYISQVINLPIAAIEMMGWVRVREITQYEKTHFDMPILHPDKLTYYAFRPLNQAQINTLFDLGFIGLLSEDQMEKQNYVIQPKIQFSYIKKKG